jgi:hypothetical protein
VVWPDSPSTRLTPAGIIHSHWQTLGGSPGKVVSDLERVGDGHRIRYEHGAIYAKDGGPMAWVHGAIGEKYEALGGARSWLGFPLADEAPFSEGGRVSVFEHGSIYWWPDVGAVELNDVVVHYTGLVCFGESDVDQFPSDSDEPYVVLGVVGPTGNMAARSPIYDDVDGGESRPDLLEIYRGKPYGVSINVLLMESDEEDPDKYKGVMEAAVGTAAAGITAAIAAVPVAGPALAALAAPLLAAVGPTVVTELNKAFISVFGLEDDRFGTATLHVTAKQMVVLAARTTNSSERGVGFKLHTSLISGDGASYKVYFGLVLA